MTTPEYPYSFSDGLASPDMASHLVGAETAREKLIREIAAEAGISPKSTAHNIALRVIDHTLQHLDIEVPEDSHGHA
jgi:hypothetical protein